jgi:hypothetical protein
MFRTRVPRISSSVLFSTQQHTTYLLILSMNFHTTVYHVLHPQYYFPSVLSFSTALAWLCTQYVLCVLACSLAILFLGWVVVVIVWLPMYNSIVQTQFNLIFALHCTEHNKNPRTWSAPTRCTCSSGDNKAQQQQHHHHHRHQHHQQQQPFPAFHSSTTITTTTTIDADGLSNNTSNMKHRPRRPMQANDAKARCSLLLLTPPPPL